MSIGDRVRRIDVRSVAFIALFVLFVLVSAALAAGRVVPTLTA